MALPSNSSGQSSTGHDGSASMSIQSATFTQHPAPVKFPPLTMSTIDIIRSTASQRWFRNTELVDLLENFQQYGFKCSPTAAPTPPTSGNIMIFNKNQVRRWRQDGHEWKKKRDGKNIKEHHEKLKVAGVDVINCCYAHHETCEGFHRRGYWMLCRPHIVLVHYLQQYKVDHSVNTLPGSLFAEPMPTGFDQYSKVVSGHGARDSRNLPYCIDDAGSLDSNNKGVLSNSNSSRKSLLSRASRDKKKVYVDNLKHSIESLTAQISELEMHSDNNNLVNEANVVSDVRETLQNPGDNSLDALLDVWFDSNISRKVQSVQDMVLIRTMLIPGAQAKFALWGLDSEQSSLWSSLLEDQFQLQPAQIAELTRSRAEAVRLRNEFNEILNECKETHRLIEEYVSRSRELIRGVRDIFPAEVLAQGLSMFDLSQSPNTITPKSSSDSLPNLH